MNVRPSAARGGARAWLSSSQGRLLMALLVLNALAFGLVATLAIENGHMRQEVQNLERTIVEKRERIVNGPEAPSPPVTPDAGRPATPPPIATAVPPENVDPGDHGGG